MMDRRVRRVTRTAPREWKCRDEAGRAASRRQCAPRGQVSRIDALLIILGMFYFLAAIPRHPAGVVRAEPRTDSAHIADHNRWGFEGYRHRHRHQVVNLVAHHKDDDANLHLERLHNAERSRRCGKGLAAAASTALFHSILHECNNALPAPSCNFLVLANQLDSIASNMSKSSRNTSRHDDVHDDDDASSIPLLRFPRTAHADSSGHGDYQSLRRHSFVSIEGVMAAVDASDSRLKDGQNYKLESLRDRIKKEAQRLYSSRDFQTSLLLFDCLLETHSSDREAAAILTNRAAIHMMMKRYADAAKDCERALELYPNLTKAQLRLGRSYLKVGQPVHARNVFLQAFHHISSQPLSGKSAELPEAQEGMACAQTLLTAITEAEKASKAGDWEPAIEWANAALGVAQFSNHLRELKTLALVGSGRKAELLTFVETTVSLSSTNTTAIGPTGPKEIGKELARLRSVVVTLEYVRALWMTPGRSIDARLTLQSAIADFPQGETPRLKDLAQLIERIGKLKVKGDSEFRNGNFHAARKAYTNALRELGDQNPHMAAILRCNRAASSMLLHLYDDAVGDCTEALRIAPYYVKAYLRRARSLVYLGQYHTALNDFHEYLDSPEGQSSHDSSIFQEMEHVYRIMQKEKSERRSERRERFSKLLEDVLPTVRAEPKAPRSGSSVKTPPVRDYYDVLGLNDTATTSEITTAYRRLAVKIHPDKHRSSKQKSQYNKAFKEIKMAYDTLVDPMKRHKYDCEGRFRHLRTSK